MDSVGYMCVHAHTRNNNYRRYIMNLGGVEGGREGRERGEGEGGGSDIAAVIVCGIFKTYEIIFLNQQINK